MPPIKFGFILPVHQLKASNRSAFVDEVNQALTLVSGHFDSVWVIDHLQDDTVDLLESFTTLAYFSALHPRLRFGHTVVCQAFRNPALLAKMGASLQFLSGGRFILGLGAGWDEQEFTAYGYNFPTARERVEQFEETLHILKALWTQPRATFTGRHYRIQNAACEPRPNPLPPILLGAFKPKMLRLTAQHADDWNVSSVGYAEYRHLRRDFEQACEAVGRDPATVTRSWGGACSCAPTQAEAEQLAVDNYSAEDTGDDFGFVGTPPQIVAQMHTFIELGVTTFILDCPSFPNWSALELLCHEVLPALNPPK